MATFVALTRDNVDEVIYVNMDQIIRIEPARGYTVLVPVDKDKDKHRYDITVKESAAAILDAIHRERKS
ncbi:hypothetical protein [Bradyrhizobium zhanjiangense]|uniref:Uncharacterized protein n=1 Tax=Bradyrhizobium zhanjiangense TaxID=1325107 RepID=A0A4Q0SSW8_9BRAD|nr:hypothetical protein [Bradyrhizobium zhanjiangense]RXH41076.1 hypothetical protein XH94_09545 [Bradyrhizobium zhanjiangense]